MRRSARLAKKQTNPNNEVRKKPKRRKIRPNDRTQNVATLDNGAMVDVFQYLNYCQLASNSLVSKRYCNVIRTHRKSLALLSVECRMERHVYNSGSATIKIFNNDLSPEAYNEWVIVNKYTTQVSLDDQAAEDAQDYELSAYGNYRDPFRKRTSVFFARIKILNNENWPLFQHFVRLVTDAFIYIRYMELTSQKDVLSLFAGVINQDRSRLKCVVLDFNFVANAQSFISWIKDHVCCGKLRIAVSLSGSNRDKQLLDFFATGSHCTSEISVTHCQLSKAVIVGLVKKFMDLKNSDESQIVQSIRGSVSKLSAEALMNNYAKFFVKEEKDDYSAEDVLEFVNDDIGKKMQLAFTDLSRYRTAEFSLKIKNL